MNDLVEHLRHNPYPGRGIALGMSEDGYRSIAVYFIMGRSENSRNRVFERTDDGIRTKAFDPAKLTDPSLVIYNPVRVLDGRTIVTNGDQTDTIRDFLLNGQDFRDALLTREFEPDPPIYTPRVSGLIESNGSYKLSILKSADSNPACCVRSFFEYSAPIPGLGHFISTYQTDGNPPPSFAGEPVAVKISGDLQRFAHGVWDALNNDNKLSLYVRETVVATGESSDIIINKNGASE
ncbi:MAG: IMP cyclohydrolase [Oscillospiraceae bacterium]|nr:IMP cyclohydrolase [Oscillospiraceae bacterium]